MFLGFVSSNSLTDFFTKRRICNTNASLLEFVKGVVMGVAS